MNAMKSKILKGVVGALFLSGMACTDHFEEMDFPKTTSTIIDPGPVFTRSLVVGSGISVGIWQLTNQLTTLDWTQYVATIKSNFTQSQYEPVPQSSIWAWWYSTESFAGLHLSDHVIRLSQQLNNPVHEAMGRIWRAYMFQYMTDMYGDIPYSKAFTSVQPAYDTQEYIYSDLIDQVQSSVAALKANRNAGYATFGTADVVFGGDIGKWIKFGNSLLLRMAMQASKVAENEITRPVLESIDFSNAAEYMSANNDNAAIIPDPNGPTYHVKNPYAFVGGWEEMRIAKTFYDRLAKNSDPRMPVYMAPNIEGAYVGLPNGQKVSDLNSGYRTHYIPNFCDMGDYFMQPETPFVLMHAAEVNFLLAEAIHKGYVAGDAAATYRKAMELSCTQYGIDPDMTAGFIAGVPFNETNLYEQMWIALFPNGPQAWNLIRRTGKPSVAPLIEHWPGNQEMPRRFSYSTDEIRYNSENVQQAIDRLGGDSHYNRVWWDQQ